MGLAVTVLTCEGGRSSGYLLEHGDRRVLVDCGPGVADAAARTVGLDRLDAVVVTHGHADHCLDLMGLAYARCFPDLLAPVRLCAPAEMRGLLTTMDDTFGVPTIPQMRRPLTDGTDLVLYDRDDPAPIDVLPGLTLSVRPARHAVPAAALRFDDGTHRVTFSGDTGPSDAVADAARDADLFVCEATYLDAPERHLIEHGHLTAALAGRTASDAGARRLLLTHLSQPEHGAAAAAGASDHFPGPVGVARRGECRAVG